MNRRSARGHSILCFHLDRMDALAPTAPANLWERHGTREDGLDHPGWASSVAKWSSSALPLWSSLGAPVKLHFVDLAGSEERTRYYRRHK